MNLISKILITFVGVFFVGCNKPPDLTEEEVYKILNEIIADDSLLIYRACWQVEKLSVSDDYGFGWQDKKFIKQQNEIFKGFRLEPNRLKFYSRREKRPVFIDIDTTCNVGILNHLSFPLISADRQRVVIANTENCNCFLGGQGGTHLYVKQKGHWKKERSFDQWISQDNRLESNEQLGHAGNRSVCASGAGG